MWNVLNLFTAFTILLLANPAEAQEPENPFGQRTVVVNPDETAIIRGHSPRRDGLNYQYNYLTTPLRGNFILSDTLLPTDEWHLWDGKPVPRFDVNNQTPENYHGSHNHYQNLLSEVINFTAGANAIPIWGDANAAVHGANAWGGFMSARSDCRADDLVGQYAPEGLDRGCGPEFDAQITGLEVDVLNGAKPGVYPNMAKHGIQIVGFGNPNSHALSVIVENFDRELPFQKGHFESILYAQSSLHPEYGRFMVTDFENAMLGLDFRRTLFSQGALTMRSEGISTGIVVNNGRSGEIYGGHRWPDGVDESSWLTLLMGRGGLRVVSNDNTKEAIAVDNHGGIYLNGDLYLNGQRVVGLQASLSMRALVLFGGAFLLLTIAVNFLLTRAMLARWKQSMVTAL